jgi:hypothetical protein
MTKPSIIKNSPFVLQTLAWARKQGFKPVALHYQSKAAISRAYVEKDYDPPSDDFWKANNYGVGLVTGPAHCGPIDVDLDCEEAIYFASVFLPPTSAVFGRKSKLRSHYLYKVDVLSFEKKAFNDPADESCIVEMRGDNGHQTCMPGSVHESTGELIEWSDVPFPDVPLVNADDLLRAVRKIAIATLIVRHIWTPGYHNSPCKHLSGTFFYLDWTVDETEQMIRAVCDYTDDLDKSRIPTVRSTYKRAESGKKVSGSGVLRKELNDDKLVDRLLEWAGSQTVNLLTEYNERWAVVQVGGKFRVVDTDQPVGEPPVFYAKDDFLNVVATDYVELDGKQVTKGKLWLASPRRRSYRAVDFQPGIQDADLLNLWTGWAVNPHEGCCDAWIELTRDVICGGDKNLFRWMCHWFANIVREPREKSLTAPVIVGVEGAGKTLMLEYFGRILGPAYVTVTKEEHIVGRFNRHMGATLLLHSEEALYGGDKKHAGIIRSLITDPWHMVEPKGIDAQKVRNYLRLALTSNDIYAAPAKPGDRRYTVIDMGDRKASSELIQRVLAEMSGDGPAALHQALLDMKYDPLVPRLNVKNESLLTLKTINLQPMESWWYDTLQEGLVLPDYLNWATKPEKADWPATVSLPALHLSMALNLKARNVRSIPTPQHLAFHLEKFCGVKFRRAKYSYDNPLLDDYPPAVKQLNGRMTSATNMPDLNACREAFERYVGQDFDWPEEEDRRGAAEVKLHDRF